MRIDRLAVPLAALLLGGCALAGPKGGSSTATPYKAPEVSDGHAGRGLKLVYVSHLGRHGSRYFTSDKRLKKMRGALDEAAAAGALTPAGHRLRDAVAEFMRVSDYENVTPLAAWQQKGIAGRLAAENPELFGGPWNGKKVRTLTTFKKRTQDTRDAFLAELAARTGADPAKDFTNLISTGCEPLRFFDCDAKYQAYKEARAWLAAPAYKALAPETDAWARQLLAQFAAPAWLGELAAGRAAAAYFASPAEMAECLYDIAGVETGLGRDLLGFRNYFSSGELAWFEYLADYSDFYEKGPGSPGSAVTYGMARGLLRDFLDGAQRAVDDPAASPAADFRFAHAETLLPLAALMALEGASEQAAEYPFKGRRWKGAAVAPMSANIQWRLYRALDGEYKLRVLLNERPAAIAGLKENAGRYYDWEAVKRFYEARLAQTGG